MVTRDQDVGGWYIENSLTTLGQKDPVSEENTRLWNTGLDSDKEIARKRKRKLSYFSNILVVSVILKHQRMKVKFSYSSLVKRYLIRLLELCNQHVEDEKPNEPI